MRPPMPCSCLAAPRLLLRQPPPHGPPALGLHHDGVLMRVWEDKDRESEDWVLVLQLPHALGCGHCMWHPWVWREGGRGLESSISHCKGLGSDAVVSLEDRLSRTECSGHI